MKKIWHGLISLVLVLPIGVAADTGTTKNNTDTGTTQTGGISDPLGVGGISGLFNKIIDGLLLLAGPIAVLMIVYAGYLFITAADSEEKVKKARSTVKYAVIGIAVLVLSKALVYVTCDFLGVSCR